MFKLFDKRKDYPEIYTDIHSHLIPGIDDGVKTLESSLEIIKALNASGVSKIITTPHIASEFYPNTPEEILLGLEIVTQEIQQQGLDIQLEAAAEYYVDFHFLQYINSSPEKILSFGDSFVLIETPFLNKPPFFEDCLFKLMAEGYKPVFAHPERYEYIHDDPEYLYRLKEKGVLFQVTASSLMGYYSQNTKKIAEWMMNHNLINFLGSDIHHSRHLSVYLKFRKSKSYRRLLKSGLLNNQL